MIPTDAAFDAISWKDIKPDDLDAILEGATILGTESVTDGEKDTGLIIYLSDRSGRDLALNIQAEIYPGKWAFYTLIGEAAK